MIRLLNMKHSVISLDYINFNSYSHSRYWRGFFEALNLQDPLISEKACKVLEDFFGDSLSDFFLLSCVLYFPEHEVQSADSREYLKKHQCSIDYFLASGLLRVADDELDKWFSDYKDSLIELPARILQISFLSKELILKFCEMYLDLVLWRITGPCFLINPKLGLALYPHDDGGFGAISLEKDNQYDKEFLNFAEQQQDFCSYFTTKTC